MQANLTSNLKHIINACFSTDKDLLSTYHISSGEGLDVCVDKTHSDLIEANVDFYEVNLDSELVGFFGIEHINGYKALTGFFIKPEYRNMKDQFWSVITSKMNGSSFLCGVYTKNTRAIKFLTKMGGIPALRIKNGIVFRMDCSCL